MKAMHMLNVVLVVVIIALMGAIGYFWHQQAITRVEGVVFQVGIGTVGESSESSLPKNTGAVILKIYGAADKAPTNLLLTASQYPDSARLLGKKIAGGMEERTVDVIVEYSDGTTNSKETLACHRLLFLESPDPASSKQ